MKNGISQREHLLKRERVRSVSNLGRRRRETKKCSQPFRIRSEQSTRSRSDSPNSARRFSPIPLMRSSAAGEVGMSLAISRKARSSRIVHAGLPRISAMFLRPLPKFFKEIAINALPVIVVNRAFFVLRTFGSKAQRCGHRAARSKMHH